jgi:hypothetical protein
MRTNLSRLGFPCNGTTSQLLQLNHLFWVCICWMDHGHVYDAPILLKYVFEIGVLL